MVAEVSDDCVSDVRSGWEQYHDITRVDRIIRLDLMPTSVSGSDHDWVSQNKTADPQRYHQRLTLEGVRWPGTEWVERDGEVCGRVLFSAGRKRADPLNGT